MFIELMTGRNLLWKIKLNIWHESRLGVGKLWPVIQIWLAACFCNNVLLEHSHAHAVMYYLWLLLYYSGRVG